MEEKRPVIQGSDPNAPEWNWDISKGVFAIHQTPVANDQDIASPEESDSPAQSEKTTGPRLLPPEQRRIVVEVNAKGELNLEVGFHENGGFVWWTLIRFSEFSQTLTSIADLERRVINPPDVEAG